MRGTRLQFKGESATHLSYSMSVLSLAVASLLCSTAVEDQWSRDNLCVIIIMLIVMMMRDWVVMSDCDDNSDHDSNHVIKVCFISTVLNHVCDNNLTL